MHALIFLFRYHKEDEQKEELSDNTNNHIWFANQIPDFACASVALLNIVNNIPGLDMGNELHDFKEFTKDMDPMTKGEMIDNFKFVKNIHNSFAREDDLVLADEHLKRKIDKAKKKEIAARGWATRKARQAAQMSSQDVPANTVKPSRTSFRSRQPTAKVNCTESVVSTPASKSTQSGRSSTTSAPSPEDDADTDCRRAPKSKPKAETNGFEDTNLRRSTRAPKPRRTLRELKDEEDESEAGFHFIAYMPIGDHVWKLDGLDYYPTDIGAFGTSENDAAGGTGNWIDAASPFIMNRMLQFQDSDVQFNLMAVVRDPAVREKADLLENVKAIQTLDIKLDGFAEDWRDIDGAETAKDTVTGISQEFGIAQCDIDGVDLPADGAAKIAAEDDLLSLIILRQRILAQQCELRSGLRDAMSSVQYDDEKAQHRRHEYEEFMQSRGYVKDFV